MSGFDDKNHALSTKKFVDLANELKDQGITPEIVSAALVTASCVYSTYVVAGNEGGLTSSGVDKMTAAYKRQLENIQKLKKEETGTVKT